MFEFNSEAKIDAFRDELKLWIEAKPSAAIELLVALVESADENELAAIAARGAERHLGSPYTDFDGIHVKADADADAPDEDADAAALRDEFISWTEAHPADAALLLSRTINAGSIGTVLNLVAFGVEMDDLPEAPAGVDSFGPDDATAAALRDTFISWSEANPENAALLMSRTISDSHIAIVAESLIWAKEMGMQGLPEAARKGAQQ